MHSIITNPSTTMPKSMIAASPPQLKPLPLHNPKRLQINRQRHFSHDSPTYLLNNNSNTVPTRSKTINTSHSFNNDMDNTPNEIIDYSPPSSPPSSSHSPTPILRLPLQLSPQLSQCDPLDDFSPSIHDITSQPETSNAFCITNNALSTPIKAKSLPKSILSKGNNTNHNNTKKSTHITINLEKNQIQLFSNEPNESQDVIQSYRPRSIPQSSLFYSQQEQQQQQHQHYLYSFNNTDWNSITNRQEAILHNNNIQDDLEHHADDHPLIQPYSYFGDEFQQLNQQPHITSSIHTNPRYDGYWFNIDQYIAYEQSQIDYNTQQNRIIGTGHPPYLPSQLHLFNLNRSLHFQYGIMFNNNHFEDHQQFPHPNDLHIYGFTKNDLLQHHDMTIDTLEQHLQFHTECKSINNDVTPISTSQHENNINTNNNNHYNLTIQTNSIPSSSNSTTPSPINQPSIFPFTTQTIPIPSPQESLQSTIHPFQQQQQHYQPIYIQPISGPPPNSIPIYLFSQQLYSQQSPSSTLIPMYSIVQEPFSTSAFTPPHPSTNSDEDDFKDNMINDENDEKSQQ